MDTINEKVAHKYLKDIERDIEKLTLQIAPLQRDLDFLLEMKGKALRTLEDQNKLQPKPEKIPVSEFILYKLEDGKRVEGNSIIEAYAIHAGKKIAEVKNNVTNAMTRLKKQNKIDNATIYGKGRKGGSEWFLYSK